MNEIQPHLGICSVCHENEAKYRCPECGAVTCCLDCSKSHSCVFEIKHPETEIPEDSEETAERLAAFYAILDDPRVVLSEEQVDELAKTYLTPKQAEDFYRKMRTGELLRRVVGQYTPWWDASVVVDEALDERDERRAQIPINNASPRVRCSLFGFVYTDVFLMRQYQGDIADDVLTAVGLAVRFNNNNEPGMDISDEIVRILGIAASIATSGECDDADDFSPEFCLGILDDVVRVFHTKQHIIHALNELQDTIDIAIKRNSTSPDKKTLRSISRKIDFHAQWLLSRSVPDFTALCIEVEKSVKAAQSSLKSLK